MSSESLRVKVLPVWLRGIIFKAVLRLTVSLIGNRAPGAIGSTTSPGHVWKGLKMGGHLGDERVTAQQSGCL